MADEVRTDAEKAQMYQAMLGGSNVITTVLDAENVFYAENTNEEKKERVMRSANYLTKCLALEDWGSEDMSSINTAVTAATNYTP